MEEPTFGDLLRDHLQKKGIIYEKLGNKVGVNKSTVSRWVSNQQKPVHDQLRRIPRALGLSEEETEELLRADGRRYSYKDLWITVPEDNPETKSEVSEQKTEESGGLSKNTESKSRTFVTQLSEAESVDQNNLRSLRHVVKENWIDNYLENSLHREAVIWLKLRENPNLVDNLPYKIIPKGEQDEPLQLGTPIIDAFDKMEQRLLILGEPGAGKTIMLLELARALLRRADENPEHPTPVVFLLGSWSQSKAPLAKWMAEELSVHYKIPKKYGGKWIEQDKLLPLLDGLDEVQSTDRAACVEAINEFRKEHFVPMAVCSRIADYESLSKLLELQGAVVLEPLTTPQINTYLNRAGPGLSALRSALVHDRELREFAESPLMLDIMTIAYQNATPEELITVDTNQTRRQNLFNTYIQRMFGRRETEQIYASIQTIQWLQWLASRLARHGQAIFQIERMQPDWLRPMNKRLSFLPLTMLVALPIYGLLFGLFGGVTDTVIKSLTGNLHTTKALNLLGVLIFSLLTGLVMGIIDGISGKFRDITLVEQLDDLFRRLKSNLYTALLWGISSLLTFWLYGELIHKLVNDIKDNQCICYSTLRPFVWINNLGITLTPGIITGLILGLVVGVTGGFRTHKPTWYLRWLWQKGKNNLYSGLMLGVVAGLCYGLIGELRSEIHNGSVLTGRLFLGCFVGLSFGIATETINRLSEKFRHNSYAVKLHVSPKFINILHFLLSGILGGWLGSTITGLLGAILIKLSDSIFLWSHYVSSVAHGRGIICCYLDQPMIADRSKLWVTVIVNYIRSNDYSTINEFISYGLTGQLGGGLTDVFFAGGVKRLLLTFVVNHQFYDFVGYGVIFGIIGGMIGTFKEIEIAKEFSWSWNRIRNNLYSGFLVASGLGVFSGLVSGLIAGTDSTQKNDPLLVIIITILTDVVFWGLGGTLLGIIVGGFIYQPSVKRTDVLEVTRMNKPNRSILLSAQYSLLTGLGGGLLLTLLAAFSTNSTLSNNLVFGLIFAPIFGLIGRGDAVVKHYVLRLILWWKGYAPWNYTRFLNYATGLIFMRKVGGGYIFVHRSIMEHFATMDKQTIERIAAASTQQKQP